MIDVVLSEKISPARRNESVPVLLKGLRETLSGLEVRVEVLRLNSRGWPLIRVSGSDEDVSEQILRQEYGIATTKLELLDPGVVTKAFVDRMDPRREALVLDAGLDSGDDIPVEYSAANLRAQLLDGEQSPLDAMVTEYCLHPGIPLEIRIPTRHPNLGRVGVMLSDFQVAKFRDWKEQPFERLIIQDAFAYEVESATRHLNVTRDLADIKLLSLTVSVLTCKLGTRAKGLVPRLGPLLNESTFYIYSGSLPSRTNHYLNKSPKFSRSSRRRRPPQDTQRTTFKSYK